MTAAFDLAKHHRQRTRQAEAAPMGSSATASGSSGSLRSRSASPRVTAGTLTRSPSSRAIEAALELAATLPDGTDLVLLLRETDPDRFAAST